MPRRVIRCSDPECPGRGQATVNRAAAFVMDDPPFVSFTAAPCCRCRRLYNLANGRAVTHPETGQRVFDSDLPNTIAVKDQLPAEALVA